MSKNEGLHSEVWQHIESGGLYTILGDALDADMSPVIVHRSLWDGSLWVRSATEFHDGRFRNICLEEICDISEPEADSDCPTCGNMGTATCPECSKGDA